MAKQPEDRRTIEVKVRFSQRELEIAEEAETKYGICRAEFLRDLYMSKIYTLITNASREDKSSAA